jgi:hypothetical protein
MIATDRNVSFFFSGHVISTKGIRSRKGKVTGDGIRGFGVKPYRECGI